MIIFLISFWFLVPKPMNPTIFGFCVTRVLLICSYLALSLEHGKILHFRVFFLFQFAHTFLKLDLGNKFCNLPNPFGVLTSFQPKMRTILVAITSYPSWSKEIHSFVLTFKLKALYISWDFMEKSHLFALVCLYIRTCHLWSNLKTWS